MKENVQSQKIKYLLCIMVCMILLITGCGGKGSWQEQYDLGLKYLEEGNYEEAIVVLTAAIEIDPKNPLAFISRGSAYINLGETEENLNNAQADYEQAISLDEQNEDGWLGLADVYIRRGDYDKATEILKEGFEKINGTAYDENTTTSADTDAGNNSAGTNSGETDKAGNISLKLEQMTSGDISDTSGRPRRTIFYYDDIEGYCIYEYDSKGKCIKSSYFLLDGTLIFYDTYEYDENGNEISRHHYDASAGKTHFWIYAYDERGNRISEHSYFGTGRLYSYTINKYDENWNMISAHTYNGYDERLEEYIIYEYDERGNRISDHWYYGDGTLRFYHIIKYDENCNIISTHTYDGDGNLIN